MLEAACSFDVFTSLTKLLYEAKNTFGMRIEPKALTIDFKNDRTYKKLIEENFHKPKNSALAEEESKEIEEYAIQLDGSTRETTISKKAPEMLQIEEEYNALMQQSIVLRRGRCGRMFTKYVQKSIFEDSEN